MRPHVLRPRSWHWPGLGRGPRLPPAPSTAVRALSIGALTGMGSPPEKRAGSHAPRFHVGVVVVPQQIAWVIETWLEKGAGI